MNTQTSDRCGKSGRVGVSFKDEVTVSFWITRPEKETAEEVEKRQEMLGDGREVEGFCRVGVKSFVVFDGAKTTTGREREEEGPAKVWESMRPEWVSGPSTGG